MTEIPDIGNISYSCTYASHPFCDGEVESKDYAHPTRCDCPCHQTDVRMKVA